jgi:NADP-dependent 3-hydroxy acid dehydrogenase YdfG
MSTPSGLQEATVSPNAIDFAVSTYGSFDVIVDNAGVERVHRLW